MIEPIEGNFEWYLKLHQNHILQETRYEESKILRVDSDNLIEYRPAQTIIEKTIKTNVRSKMFLKTAKKIYWEGK